MRVIIKNGTVIDGTGKSGAKQDVWLENDRIYRLGDFKKVRAEVIINARGLVVAPGFIDILNHSDVYLTLFRYPAQESLLWQGITTIVGGMCGSSLAPLTNVNVINSIRKWAEVNDFSVDWLKMSEFLSAVASRGVGVNFASLVGHSTLRRGLVGDDFRALTEEELKKMEYLLEQALADGAFGFSSGLAYSHAKIAPGTEITRLLKIVKKYNGLYASHIRGEGQELIFALEEAIQAAKGADVGVEISHFKAMGKPFWPLFAKALNKITKARRAGVNITFNVYPYRKTGSVLYTLLPDWLAEGGREKMLDRLGDPAIRGRAVAEMRAECPYEYDKVTISMIRANETLVGKTIAAMALNENIAPEEAVMNVLVGAQGRAIAQMDVLNERNIRKAIRHEASHIASDGAGYSLAHAQRKELVHPRSFGAFPRALARYVKHDRLTLEEMIAKMTSRPAQTLDLKERGVIRKGAFADIVVFNEKTFRDYATFTNPYQYARGVEYLLINGAEVIREKQYLGVLAGRVLRKS